MVDSVLDCDGEPALLSSNLFSSLIPSNSQRLFNYVNVHKKITNNVKLYNVQNSWPKHNNQNGRPEGLGKEGKKGFTVCEKAAVI